jgi:hypothetical protein
VQSPGSRSDAANRRRRKQSPRRSRANRRALEQWSPRGRAPHGARDHGNDVSGEVRAGKSGRSLAAPGWACSEGSMTARIFWIVVCAMRAARWRNLRRTGRRTHFRFVAESYAFRVTSSTSKCTHHRRHVVAIDQGIDLNWKVALADVGFAAAAVSGGPPKKRHSSPDRAEIESGL